MSAIMSTKSRIKTIALALGLGTALVASMSAPSLAATRSEAAIQHQSREARNARAQAVAPAPRIHHTPAPGVRASGGPYYYEGDDNGSAWSYYPGYVPLR